MDHCSVVGVVSAQGVVEEVEDHRTMELAQMITN